MAAEDDVATIDGEDVGEGSTGAKVHGKDGDNAEDTNGADILSGIMAHPSFRGFHVKQGVADAFLS